MCDFPWKTRYELEQCEKYWINETKSCINIIMNDKREGKSKKVKKVKKVEPSCELCDTKVSQIRGIAGNRFRFSIKTPMGTKRAEKRFKEDNKDKVRKRIERMRKKMTYR